MRTLKIALVVFAIGCGETLTFGQVYVNRMPPPQNMAEFAASADAIARVSILEIEDIALSSGSAIGGNSPYIKFTATLRETIKNGERLPADGGTLTFLGIGSTASPEVGFRTFRRREDVVLFLKWVPGVNAFQVAHGPEGAFAVSSDGALVPFGRTPIAKEIASKPLDAAITELRQTAGLR